MPSLVCIGSDECCFESLDIVQSILDEGDQQTLSLAMKKGLKLKTGDHLTALQNEAAVALYLRHIEFMKRNSFSTIAASKTLLLLQAVTSKLISTDGSLEEAKQMAITVLKSGVVSLSTESNLTEVFLDSSKELESCEQVLEAENSQILPKEETNQPRQSTPQERITKRKVGSIISQNDAIMIVDHVKESIFDHARLLRFALRTTQREDHTQATVALSLPPPPVELSKSLEESLFNNQQVNELITFEESVSSLLFETSELTLSEIVIRQEVVCSEYAAIAEIFDDADDDAKGLSNSEYERAVKSFNATVTKELRTADGFDTRIAKLESAMTGK